jgi:3-hydroxyisobutyrate dehydrogenase
LKRVVERSATMAKVAFVGLGLMGLPMATNLSKAGHVVRGFDMAPTRVELAARAGISAAGSTAEAIFGADAIITKLPSGADTLAVWSGAVPEAAGKGTLLIDSSTIDVGSARAAHNLATEAGLLSLDAPVSGGVAGAEAGSLTFMCGGSESAFAQAGPLLQAMGRRIVHCGDAGAGQAAKICNNLILGISMIGVAEAFVLAEKLGLSRKSLFDVASTSSGQCWSLTSYCPAPGLVAAAPSNSGYKPGFSSALMLKDLRLAQSAASEAGANSPLGAAAAQIYALHNAWGEGGGIINLLRGKLGSTPES